MERGLSDEEPAMETAPGRRKSGCKGPEVGSALVDLPQTVWTPNCPFPFSTAKRPAPARPNMPPPQVSSTRSSPPTPPLPPGSGSPVTPRALPRRLVGSSLRAPTVPPPLPPMPPQPARRQSRRSPASPNQAPPGPASPSPVSPSMPAQVDMGTATEEGGGPEAAGRASTPPAMPPQPRPRSLASETD